MKERDLLRVLVEFATTLTDDFSIQDILDRLTEQIVMLLPVTGAGVLLMDLMDMGGGHHFVSATDDQLRRIEGLQVELGEGPCLTAYETDHYVAVVDLSSDVTYPRFSPAAASAGLGAVFSFPLRHGGERIGALELYASEPVVLTTTEFDGGQTLADGGPCLALGMSIGMALAGSDHDTPENALIRADAAMYRARQRGGNQRVNAADLSLVEGDREHGIDADLASALAVPSGRSELPRVVTAGTPR